MKSVYIMIELLQWNETVNFLPRNITDGFDSNYNCFKKYSFKVAAFSFNKLNILVAFPQGNFRHLLCCYLYHCRAGAKVCPV